jgi:hypothetical protein
MELEIKNTELITPAKAYDVTKEVNQRINQKIETQRLITGLDKKEISPYGFMTPSLANNDVLTDAGTYVLNFEGNLDNSNLPNTQNVLHLFGGTIEFKQYLALSNFNSTIGIYGYGVTQPLTVLTGLTKLNDLDKFASLAIYSLTGSIRVKINVTGTVSNPIIWARSYELKGTSGIVSRNIPTYFDSSDQNTQTQHLQENQVLASDRIVAILTKPQVLTINVSPIN